MNETILGIVIMAVSIICTIYVCRSSADGSTGTRAGRDTGSVGDDLEAAGRGNSELEAAERTTEERLEEQAGTIERAAEGNRRGQELVQKARDILHSAKHTD